jgi:hypothetical protein
MRRSKRDLLQEVEDLEGEYPDRAEWWVRALARTLEGGSMDVQEGDGVIRLTEDAADCERPDGWIHVATGPAGISEEFARTWDLYADPDVHSPPVDVTEADLPVKVFLASGSAFA